MNPRVLSHSIVFCFLAVLPPASSLGTAQAKDVVIVTPRETSWAENLAAREVRRYLYLRTGQLFPTVSETDRSYPSGDLIVVSRKDRDLLANIPETAAAVRTLEPEGYLLKTLHRNTTAKYPTRWRNRDLLLVVGGDDAGTLYGAYRLAEILGARFYLHDDVLPDQQVTWQLPALDERSKPLFAIRGIQPFHDFPEGPDWWNRDDYLAILSQLPKLRMNFFGLHTYPEERPNAEPTVWIGPESEIGAEGRVKSSYSSSYQNSLRGNWGYQAKKTGEYVFGASELFERDDFGGDVMGGHLPAPATPEACNDIFNRTGPCCATPSVSPIRLG